MINKLLNNRYLIVEKIGSGGMATVYKAKDQLLDRVVAVKILHPADLHDEDSIRKFRREARAAGSLSHFNIVSVYDVGQQDDVYYIVMELIEGVTLKEYIIQHKKLAVNEAIKIAIQICDALNHAHSNGVVHRDIKPQNIIITKDGNIKVADFGIARAISSDTLTRSKDIFGSVRYFSPEQASGETVGVKSDMYSLGIVLYEMLSGILPFKGETPIAWALQHINDEPIALKEVEPSIPDVLSEIVMKTLQKNPDDRFEGIGELKIALKNFKEGLPVEIDMAKKKQTKNVKSTPISPKPAPKTTGKRKTNKALIISILIIALAALGYGAFVWVQDYLTVPEVTVPNVEGDHFQVATTKIEELGLRIVVIATQNHPTIPANHVISQDPISGSIVKEGREIGVTLSQGLEFGTVPNVIGMSKNDAEIALFNEGFMLGVVTEIHDDNVEIGHVILQNPRPDTEVKKDTPVDIAVSLGPDITLIPMPNLVGLTTESAMQAIVDNDLVLGNVTEEKSNQPAGVVIGQDIEAGSNVSTGTTINIVVSNGRTP